MPALIDFALLTGCRPNEACQLRPCDLDKTNPDCWVFRPQKHKSEHHGHERLILIGPQAQAAIVFFLAGCAADDYVFSPCREETRRLERRNNRKTPHTPSSLARYERAALRIRRRHPRGCYTTGSLRTAIHRACRKAGVKPVWGPNRLRHTRATELRGHGLDVVGTIIGHKKLETTQVYSERDLKAAMELIAKVG